MQYCRTCFYPSTKPDLIFNELGVCSACTAFYERKIVNWSDREKQFKLICEGVINKREKTGAQYDCIIPVSGGKDSHWQVIKAKEYGLEPLCICAVTDDLSAIGYYNLNNLAKIAPVERVYTDMIIRRKINKYTLQIIGDISWAEHVTIFTIPFKKALEHNIDLILWGENPQNEYGGPTTAQEEQKLGSKWLAEFGGLNGLRVSDVEYALNVELPEYKYDKELKNRNIQSIFMGAYFPWDGYKNAIEARKNGFVWSSMPVEGNGFQYENLDNYQTGIHDYFKYLKFGFGRATDMINNHLRRDRITREEAKEHILKWDGQYPYTYLGKNVEEILKDIDMSLEEWKECVNKFANKKLFDVELYPPLFLFRKEIIDA